MIRSRHALFSAILGLFGASAFTQDNKEAKEFYYKNRPSRRFSTDTDPSISRYTKQGRLHGTRGAFAGMRANPKKYVVVSNCVRNKKKLLGTRG